ncbi:MAG: redoxin domain-containing protein, partial [Candidatus Aenigmarchaeota archaeon]|nr:redoxin domain-containing protein [Candidatus Aenigmarchaeota archaeon]
MNSSKLFPALLIASVLFVSGCTGQQTSTASTATGSGSSASGEIIGNDVGNRAPDFTVTTTDGRTLKLGDFKGKKPVVLLFMATWCPFCSQEYEEMGQVYPQYADKVEFLSVDLDVTENALVLEQYRVSKKRPG